MVVVDAIVWLSVSVLAVVTDDAHESDVLPRVSLLALTILIAVSAAAADGHGGQTPLCLCLLLVLPVAASTSP